MQGFSRCGVIFLKKENLYGSRRLYAPGPGSGPGGGGVRRGARGLRHRAGWAGNRPGPQPPGGEAAHRLPCGDGGHLPGK